MWVLSFLKRGIRDWGVGLDREGGERISWGVKERCHLAGLRIIRLVASGTDEIS